MTDLPRSEAGPSTTAINDRSQLEQFGYEQELNRSWGLLQNFGVSFSIISVITGLTTLFGYGLANGGPAVMSIGWLVISVATISVATAMAEVCSALPTSGGPYFWAALLAPPKWAPFMAWLTGWFNFLGQVAVTTGISFGLAGLISTAITVKNPDFQPTEAKTIGIYAAILLSHGLINTFGSQTLRHLNNFSILLHSVGVTSICIAVLVKAPTHQNASFVFGHFVDGTGVDGHEGWGDRASPAYVVLIGALMSQFTQTGFDASAHLSEETHNASWSAPIGVVSSVVCSAIFGFFVLLSFLFSIQDLDRTMDGPYGQPVLQILVDCMGEDGAVAVFSIICLCVWHCGLFSITSNSRMMYAFARDGGIHSFFDNVNSSLKVPVRAIWLAILLAFILALPSLGSTVAYAAATSIATIGLYISYGLPVMAGLIWHNEFKKMKGPFNLHGFSRPVGIVCCLWIALITVVFCLPNANPVTTETLNYTPVAVGILLAGTLGSWVIYARHWFVGPSLEIQDAIRAMNKSSLPSAPEKSASSPDVKTP
ncbi:APC amino acid permease, variant [Ceratocystis lukuohia]|uniref:APC amino acid permease, variant n=1 Tax=Ceratocystis lukuohia TaxID=2019550 RepID=A0ABR4M9P0_9PEZI